MKSIIDYVQNVDSHVVSFIHAIPNSFPHSDSCRHTKMCEMGKNSNRYISVYLTLYSFHRDVLHTKLSRMISCFEWYHVSSCYLADYGAKADMLPSAAKRLKVRIKR